MARAPATPVRGVTFELDAIELLSGERCLVRGRWFGVRGRRFMRPALTVVLDGRPVRLLADLADKPWAAEDGAPWRAAFPYPADADGVSEAELTVGPDATIMLPAPQPRTSRRRKPATARAAATTVRAAATTGRTAPASRARPERRASGDLHVSEASQATQRLQRQLQSVEAERAQADTRIEALTDQLGGVQRQLDQARAARDQLTAELDALRDERDALRDERDRMAVDLDRLARERQEAIADRDHTAAAAEQAAAERDAALAAAERARSEQAAATAALEATRAQRDESARIIERLQSELTDLLSARGAALVMRRAAQESGPGRYRTAPIVAAAVLLAIIVGLILLLTHVL